MATAVETVKVEALFTELVSMKTIIDIASVHVATLSLAKGTLVQHATTLRSLLSDLPPSYDASKLQKLIDDMDELFSIESNLSPPIEVGELLNRCMSELKEQIGALESKMQTKYDNAIAKMDQRLSARIDEVEQMALAKICLRQMIQHNVNAFKTCLFDSTSCWPRDSSIKIVTSALSGQPIGNVQPDKATAELSKKAKNRQKRQKKKAKKQQAASPQPLTESLKSGSGCEASAKSGNDDYTATSCDETQQFEAAKKKLQDLSEKFASAKANLLSFAEALENQKEWGNEQLHHAPGKLLAEWVADAQASAKVETTSEMEASEKAKEKFRKKFDHLVTKEHLDIEEVSLMIDGYWLFLSEVK